MSEQKKLDILAEFSQCGQAQMGYVKFNSNPIEKSEAYLDELDMVFDFDSGGRLVGIEFLTLDKMPEIHGEGSKDF